MAKKIDTRKVLFGMIYNVAALLELNEIDALQMAAAIVRKGGKFNAKDLEKGARVEVTWPEDGSTVAGKVTQVEEHTAHIKFDDGEYWWLPIALVTSVVTVAEQEKIAEKEAAAAEKAAEKAEAKKGKKAA